MIITGRTLALDPGEVRTGAAISDSLGLTAQPVGVWERTGYKSDLREIKKVMHEYGDVTRIVVGLPINLDGSHGERAAKCKWLANKLRGNLNIEVILWDERLTTVMAERTLIEAGVSRTKRKGLVDQLAAQLILQNFLSAEQARLDHDNPGETP